MKNIRIKSLSLENFKTFRGGLFNLDKDIIEINGKNETGKTSLVDAIIWCLFNKDHLYRTQFAIKTHDEQGDEIPNIEHSVTMEIDVDGVQRTLKRSLKEKWTKPRGQAETVFSGNYQECFIDGSLVSSTDYSKFVNALAPEEVFKSITSPTYFLSLPWQSRRNLLAQMAGTITDDEIIGSDPRFDALRDVLKKERLEDYIKHLKFQIKELKKKLNDIPVRLSEQNKALPEKQDWENVEEQLKVKQKEYDALVAQKKIEATLSPEEKERKRINDKIAQKEALKLERQKAVEALYKAKVTEQQERHREADAKIRSNKMDIASYILPLNREKSLIVEKEAILEKCKVDTLRIREEWGETQNMSFSLPDGIEICPECGNFLTPEQVEAKRKSLHDAFNIKKSEKIKQLKEEASKVKDAKAEAEEAIDAANKKIVEINNQTKVLEEENEILLKVKPYPEEVFTDMLMNDEQYTSADADICNLKLKLEEVGSDDSLKPLVPEDNTKEMELRNEISSLTSLLATKIQYEKIKGLIAGIEKENKDLAQQLAYLEQKEDVVNEYTTRADEILEERVNRYFSMVKWKMFRTNINGSREPYCECTFKGTEASNGLNSAGFIMAGVDVCNAIAKYYQISAPVIIDNAESINKENFLPTCGQQIRLSVSDSEMLTIN